MIVAGHGRTDPRHPRCNRRLGVLQPRDRAAGDGRQGGARRRSPAPGARVGADPARAVDVRDGAVDPGLAAAGDRAVAGSAGGRAAGTGRRADRARVRGPTDAARARRAQRAPGDGRDRDRRDRGWAVRAAAEHRPHLRAVDDPAGAAGIGAGEPAAVHVASAATLAGVGDDRVRGPGVRVERDRNQARLRRSVLRVLRPGDRLGAGHRGGLGGGRAQRVELLASATGDPGRAGRVRDSDDRADRGRSTAVRRALLRDAAERGAARVLAGAAGAGRRGARAFAAAVGADGRRARQP